MLLLLVLLAGSFLVFRSDSLLFRLYSSKLFHTELSGNTLTLHYLIADPSTYGLNEDPVLPVYSGAEEDREKETASLKNALSVLSRISTDHLSSEDAYTCLLTERYLQSQLKATAFPYYPEPFPLEAGSRTAFLPFLPTMPFAAERMWRIIFPCWNSPVITLTVSFSMKRRKQKPVCSCHMQPQIRS